MPNNFTGQMARNDCLMGLVRKRKGISLYGLIKIMIEGGRNRSAVVLRNLTMGQPSKKRK